MTYINHSEADGWIEANCPENGWFRVYWTKDGILAQKNRNHTGQPQTSFEDLGLGIRYEWKYKDGERADGISRCWYPNGNLKHEQTWKNGVQHGEETWWWENGQIRNEGEFKEGKYDKIINRWTEDGKQDLKNGV